MSSFLVVGLLQAEAEQSSITLDLNKINSSTVKPAISFDALEESLTKIERQLADTATQVQVIKTQVYEVKKAAQEQMKTEAKDKERLLLQLQEAQEAHTSLQHQVAHNEVAICLDQELSSFLAATVTDPEPDDVALPVVVQACNAESDNWQENDEEAEDEYEDEL